MTIKQMLEFARKIIPLNTGYDQGQRWTWLDKTNRRIIPNKETDCSTLCAGLAYLGGWNVNISGTCWTGNLDVLMKNAGWKVYKYTSISDVKTGDMVLKKGAHVVLCIGPNQWLSAQNDERGKSSGGQPGNQTGKEVVIRAPYTRAGMGGWDYILRPPADPVVKPPKPNKPSVNFRVGSWNVKKGTLQKEYDADANFIIKKLRCSLSLLQEVTDRNLTAILIKMGARRWDSSSSGYTAILSSVPKYLVGKSETIIFENNQYHRATKTEVKSTINGESFVLCTVHIRPNKVLSGSTQQKIKQKQDDVRKVISFLAKHPNVVVGGDWCTKHARPVLEAAGYKLATPWVDTYAPAGVQPLDAIYIRGPRLKVRNLYGKKGPGEVHKPGSASDHKGVVANLTLTPSPVITN